MRQRGNKGMYDKKKCSKCKYSAKVNDTEVCCVYIIIEEHMRGCYGSGICPKFVERKKARKAINTNRGFVYED